MVEPRDIIGFFLWGIKMKQERSTEYGFPHCTSGSVRSRSRAGKGQPAVKTRKGTKEEIIQFKFQTDQRAQRATSDQQETQGQLQTGEKGKARLGGVGEPVRAGKSWLLNL